MKSTYGQEIRIRIARIFIYLNYKLYPKLSNKFPGLGWEIVISSTICFAPSIYHHEGDNAKKLI